MSTAIEGVDLDLSQGNMIIQDTRILPSFGVAQLVDGQVQVDSSLAMDSMGLLLTYQKIGAFPGTLSRGDVEEGSYFYILSTSSLDDSYVLWHILSSSHA